MSFLAELRRRKVFQVAAVYAVTAWLLVQVIVAVEAPLNLPGWADTFVIVLLAVGFPIALIMSWAFDLQPAARGAAPDAEHEVGVRAAVWPKLAYLSQALILLAVGFLVFDQYLSGARSGADRGAAAPTLTAASRVALTVPPQTRIQAGSDPSVAISADGERIVFALERADGTVQLYLRTLDRFEAVPIPGTRGAELPFFSPDGQWIAFLADGALYKVAVEGGSPVKIADTPIGYRGASWAPDDTIILGGNNMGLSSVSADGGTLEQITTIDRERGESYHAWPHALATGRAVLFTIQGTAADVDSAIAVLSLETGEWMPIEGTLGGSQPHHVETGHLVFARSGGLFVTRFDEARLMPAGAAVQALGGVQTKLNAGLALSDFALSRTGRLVFVPASDAVQQLVLVGRDGRHRELTTAARDAHPYGFDVSPEGRRIAYAYNTTLVSSDVWVLDISRHTRTRLTTEGARIRPLWTPDGSNVTFAAWTNGSFNLYSKPADRRADAAALLQREYGQLPMSWTPDGETLAFIEEHPESGYDIWLLHRDASDPAPLLATRFDETSPAFSPGGRWLAYASDESDRAEVYVQPYPEVGPRWQVSTGGGEYPVWSPRGDELFFISGPSLMSVEIETEPTFSSGTPKVLFDLPVMPEPVFDVMPGGDSFVLMTGGQEPLTALGLVLGWAQELERLVPRE